MLDIVPVLECGVPRSYRFILASQVTFTGSVATGKAIAASCTKMCKRFTLELGGNDAAIVREDCDMDKAAQGIFNGAFGNSGQVHTLHFAMLE